MFNISKNKKRMWIAGYETEEKKHIVQFNIYSWAIGKVRYDDNLGCMYVVSRIKKGILAVVYIHKEEFLTIQKKISDYFKEYPAYKKYSFGEQWEFSMKKVRNITSKVSA